MNDRHREALSVLGYFFLLNGKTGKALILFRALRELFPGEPLFAGSLGYASLASGDYEGALAASEAFLEGETDPEARSAGCLLRGKALWGLGDAAGARKTLNDGLRREEGGRK
jgi:Flp pilus assembly protein TadD